MYHHPSVRADKQKTTKPFWFPGIPQKQYTCAEMYYIVQHVCYSASASQTVFELMVSTWFRRAHTQQKTVLETQAIFD